MHWQVDSLPLSHLGSQIKCSVKSSDFSQRNDLHDGNQCNVPQIFGFLKSLCQCYISLILLATKNHKRWFNNIVERLDNCPEIFTDSPIFPRVNLSFDWQPTLVWWFFVANRMRLIWHWPISDLYLNLGLKRLSSALLLSTTTITIYPDYFTGPKSKDT